MPEADEEAEGPGVKQMAGSRKRIEALSEFWCINCGRQGIPIMRETSRQREYGHRKALYFITCRMRLNHVETRNEEVARMFREDFKAGKYAEEAEKAVAYAKEHNN